MGTEWPVLFRSIKRQRGLVFFGAYRIGVHTMYSMCAHIGVHTMYSMCAHIRMHILGYILCTHSMCAHIGNLGYILCTLCD